MLCYIRNKRPFAGSDPALAVPQTAVRPPTLEWPNYVPVEIWTQDLVLNRHLHNQAVLREHSALGKIRTHNHHFRRMVTFQLVFESTKPLARIEQAPTHYKCARLPLSYSGEFKPLRELASLLPEYQSDVLAILTRRALKATTRIRTEA